MDAEIGLVFADMLRMFVMNEQQSNPVACSADVHMGAAVSSPNTTILFLCLQITNRALLIQQQQA